MKVMQKVVPNDVSDYRLRTLVCCLVRTLQKRQSADRSAPTLMPVDDAGLGFLMAACDKDDVARTLIR